ncbi:MAG: hypothetical protein H7A37_03245 [Chlamydiales bacterium]|nr:hypothetical protein [Chlamydiia bacterium]MCP5507302.1 hypothetical protein [Chlamydiales bacterium]
MQGSSSDCSIEQLSNVLALLYSPGNQVESLAKRINEFSDNIHKKALEILNLQNEIQQSEKIDVSQLQDLHDRLESFKNKKVDLLDCVRLYEALKEDLVEGHQKQFEQILTSLQALFVMIHGETIQDDEVKVDQHSVRCLKFLEIEHGLVKSPVKHHCLFEALSTGMNHQLSSSEIRYQIGEYILKNFSNLKDLSESNGGFKEMENQADRLSEYLSTLMYCNDSSMINGTMRELFIFALVTNRKICVYSPEANTRCSLHTFNKNGTDPIYFFKVKHNQWELLVKKNDFPIVTLCCAERGKAEVDD